MPKAKPASLIDNTESLLSTLVREATLGDRWGTDKATGQRVIIKEGPSFSERLKLVSVAANFAIAKARLIENDKERNPPDETSGFQQEVLDALSGKTERDPDSARRGRGRPRKQRDDAEPEQPEFGPGSPGFDPLAPAGGQFNGHGGDWPFDPADGAEA